MSGEADVQEESAGIVYDCINTAKLLESLYGAGDEEAASTVDFVFFEQSAPGAGVQDCLFVDGAKNLGVEG